MGLKQKLAKYALKQTNFTVLLPQLVRAAACLRARTVPHPYPHYPQVPPVPQLLASAPLPAQNHGLGAEFSEAMELPATELVGVLPATRYISAGQVTTHVAARTPQLLVSRAYAAATASQAAFNPINVDAIDAPLVAVQIRPECAHPAHAPPPLPSSHPPLP